MALSEIAAPAAQLLLDAGHKVAVFESSSGGLLSAALQAVPGASKYTTFNAVTYSRRNTAAALPGLKLDFAKPTTAEGYRASKNEWTASVAGQMRTLVPEATWCVAESGACGPTFNYDGIKAGFTSICVAGPITKSCFVESGHADREANMRLFVKAALDLLAQCIREAAVVGGPPAVAAADAAPMPPQECLTAEADRYGGVIAKVGPGASPSAFGATLRRRVAEWREAGKRGVWLKVPLDCAELVGPAAEMGFDFHHAKPGYVLLTMWIPDSPSPLPLYAFTQIGVGGVVVNDKGEVLMVQERVSPREQYQGSWKLPGGLADPGETFAAAAEREVMEETGVPCELVGVTSMRHTHGYRFGQSDIYVLVRMKATDSTITIDPQEIGAARWMSPEHIKSIVEPDPTAMYRDKVSGTNWELISSSLYGRLVTGTEVISSRGSSWLYRAEE